MSAFLRKIQCPRHFVLKRALDPRTGLPFAPFKMQINPELKNLPKWAFQKWPSILKYIPIKDRFGNKIRDDKSFYQTLMSAAYFVHQVYDTKNWICKMQCRGRCLEGLGNRVKHNKNKRLMGVGAFS